MTIKVILVDDHPIVRSGLHTVLEGNDVTVVGEAASGEEAILLAKHVCPDVVLCDLRLETGMNGIKTTTGLRELNPAPAVLILTTFDRDAEILGAIEAGATGYLVKDVAPEVIIEAIKQAATGKMFLAPDVASRVIQRMRSPLPKLTDREIEVLKHLATGATNRQIARTLFVTEATVKTHLVHIFTKLDVDSRITGRTCCPRYGVD